MSHLYSDLANKFVQSIDRGVYKAGERLPGIRITSNNAGVSTATVVAAYRRLEQEGYIEAKPKSGFFVRPKMQTLLAEPRFKPTRPRPKPVSGQERVLRLIQNIGQANLIQFGANVPDASYLPTHAISKAVSKVSRKYKTAATNYEVPPGLPLLRQQIARRMVDLGSICRPDDVLITNGCQEALYLTLKSTTKAGDVVAVESPTYYGLLQIIDSLGLKALEIPTHPREGISISALRQALEQWPIRACIVAPNFSNPTSALMPEANRSQLLGLISEFPAVSFIEDDVYGDLYFGSQRPGILQSLDSPNVFYCSSFSKSLSPGLRIGWVVAPKIQDRLEYEKFVTNCATPTLNQLATAELLAKGRYDNHLKGMRIALCQAMSKLANRVHQHFPHNTKVTRPSGGMALWVELDKSISATDLADIALAKGISLAPGPIFSSTGQFKHYIRLTCAVAWNEPVEEAIKLLGTLVKKRLQTK
ncbi:MAG: PLP-dependent aminotransferase family protein [Gammaproteobacteria bacterium]|nr:PLP-dependent aminotransferase family protein [Gammaproteobacteria bacterium]